MRAGALHASVHFSIGYSLALVAGLLGLVSAAGSVNGLLVTTTAQLFSWPEYVGRVSSLFLVVSTGSSVLSFCAFTSLEGALGLASAYDVFGLSAILAVLPLCWFRPPGRLVT